MGVFHALVDAVPGREPEVLRGLEGLARVVAVSPCKEGSYDFLVRFECPSFDVVDDFLQTHVRSLQGVKAVEVVTRPEEYGPAVRAALGSMG